MPVMSTTSISCDSVQLWIGKSANTISIIQAHALSQVPRSGDQADAGRCQCVGDTRSVHSALGGFPLGSKVLAFAHFYDT